MTTVESGTRLGPYPEFAQNAQPLAVPVGGAVDNSISMVTNWPASLKK